ncbi:MAG: asparagine synthase (glutamine-hydrolyzing) [Fuerstiella sp.]
MCGIAGAIDLQGTRRFSQERLLRMTGAISHRGPDDEQIHIEGPVALSVRRLAVIDVAHGRQPLSNENGDVWVAYEGELYEYPELRRELIDRGHTLRTHCDTEAWVHLYEDFRERVFDHARGQFGVSLWDARNRSLILGRDRFGISPMFYAVVDGWLIWASEIKGILASGLIQAKPDLKGLDCFFNFFAMPPTRTCFEGIQCLPPGHFIKVHDWQMQIHQYWDFDYPDAVEERRFESPAAAAEEFEELLRGAVRRRLAGERQMCCYISGGLDSTTIPGLACQEHQQPLPSYTIGLDHSGPNDERAQAAESASLLGSPLTTVSMSSFDIANTFPELIRAAESPVLDTSAACMIRLAHAARRHGSIVALTGEGADELLAGYIWFKTHQVVLRTGRPNASCRNPSQTGPRRCFERTFPERFWATIDRHGSINCSAPSH